jgi:phage FluMu protein gp41
MEEKVNGTPTLSELGEIDFIEAVKTVSVVLPTREGPTLVVSEYAPGIMAEILVRAGADATFGERVCKAVAIHQLKMGQLAASMLEPERIVRPPGGLILPRSS